MASTIMSYFPAIFENVDLVYSAISIFKTPLRHFRIHTEQHLRWRTARLLCLISLVWSPPFGKQRPTKR